MKGTRNRRTPFPVRSLALAAAFHLTLLAVLGWYIQSSSRSIAALQSQEFHTLDRMNATAQASENRANSAHMGVATADPHWRERHRDLNSDWNLALMELRRLAPSEFGAEAGRRLAESAAELFRIEEQALDLALQGKRAAAEALLLAEPYDLELRTFSRSSEQIRGWLGDRLRLMLDSQSRRATAVKTLFALASPILLCLWFFSGRIALRHIRHWRRTEARLRDNEQRLTTLFEGIEDAVLVHDLQGRILDCNKAASRRLGYAREELLALNTSDVETPEFAAGFAERCARQMDSGVYSYEGVHRSKDGSLIPVDINSRVINYLGSAAILATIHDITERKRAEIELSRLHGLAEAASAAKSEFLANMSHEIRTPMNGILGMTELTLGTELSDDQREYLQMVKHSADSLLTMIDDILDFSKIEAGKLALEPVEFQLRSGLAEVTRALAARARQKGLDLDFRIAAAVPDKLIGDPWRLKQVIVNLAGNAIKFTNHGKILIAVDVAAPQQGEAVLHFTVTDTGIGIPQKDLQAIFEPFRQGDGSSTRKYGGAGLGLAISAQLSALMNGEIWAESEPGKGSAFHFTARLGIPEPQASSGAGFDPPSFDLEGIRVLLVDGDAASRRNIQEMLSSWRMTASAVDGFDAALEALDQAAGDGRPFALAILDAEISGGRGLELAESIRARAGAIRPAILILTSTAEMNGAETLHTLGIGACLRKPVQQCDLMDAITTTIASESLQRLGVFSRQPSSEPRDAPASIDAARVRNILAAEDNLVNQRLLLRMLKKRGHSVVMVSNGREAVEALIREKFDLVLLDIQMPEMSGLEAAAAIRARELEENQRLGAAVHIPIIAVTANCMKGDRERCLAAGMDGYIAKPVHPEELFETVENLPIIQVSAPEITFDAALFEGDLDFLAEIVNLFLETYPSLLSAIEDAVSRKDAAGLTRAAHTLKGAVANFGAKSVVEQARALEMMGKKGDLSSAEEGWRQLRALMSKLTPELQGALERATAPQVVM